MRDAIPADQRAAGARRPASLRLADPASCRCARATAATATLLPSYRRLSAGLRVLVQVGKSAAFEKYGYHSGRSSLPSSYSYNKRIRVPRPAAPLPSFARPRTTW
jgi:hypothetical protein